MILQYALLSYRTPLITCTMWFRGEASLSICRHCPVSLLYIRISWTICKEINLCTNSQAHIKSFSVSESHSIRERANADPVFIRHYNWWCDCSSMTFFVWRQRVALISCWKRVYKELAFFGVSPWLPYLKTYILPVHSWGTIDCLPYLKT